MAELKSFTEFGNLTKFGIPDTCSVLTIILHSKLTNLLPAEQDQAIALFSKYRDVFATSELDLGCAKYVLHYIDTVDSPPIRLFPLGDPWLQIYCKQGSG